MELFMQNTMYICMESIFIVCTVPLWVLGHLFWLSTSPMDHQHEIVSSKQTKHVHDVPVLQFGLYMLYMYVHKFVWINKVNTNVSYVHVHLNVSYSNKYVYLLPPPPPPPIKKCWGSCTPWTFPEFWESTSVHDYPELRLL